MIREEESCRHYDATLDEPWGDNLEGMPTGAPTSAQGAASLNNTNAQSKTQKVHHNVQDTLTRQQHTQSNSSWYDGAEGWLSGISLDQESGQEDESDQLVLDQIQETLAEQSATAVSTNLSYDKLCRARGVPVELNNEYYTFLMGLTTKHGQPRFTPEDIPRGRGKYIKAGLVIPEPYGRAWRELVESRNIIRGRNKMHVIEAESAEMLMESREQAARDARSAQIIALHTTRTRLKSANNVAKSEDPELSKLPPKTISDALRQESLEEAYQWSEAINSEWNGLTEMGVLKHSYTLAQAREMGIETKPINFSTALTFKRDKDNKIYRYKCRICVAGRKFSMQKGVHYDKTYAACPIHYSSKLLQGLMVRLKLKRLTFDISQAYCHGELPDQERIILRYPSGFRRWDENGTEIFAMLAKNSYGIPQGAHRWEKTRNRKMLQASNKDGFTCTRCIKDQCIFCFTYHGERAWMQIHTDDGEICGEDDEINRAILDRVNSMWPSKLTDEEFLLGVRRQVKHEGDEMVVELSMGAYIDAMEKAFSESILKRALPDTPSRQVILAQNHEC